MPRLTNGISTWRLSIRPRNSGAWPVSRRIDSRKMPVEHSVPAASTRRPTGNSCSAPAASRVTTLVTLPPAPARKWSTSRPLAVLKRRPGAALAQSHRRRVEGFRRTAPQAASRIVAGLAAGMVAAEGRHSRAAQVGGQFAVEVPAARAVAVQQPLGVLVERQRIHDAVVYREELGQVVDRSAQPDAAGHFAVERAKLAVIEGKLLEVLVVKGVAAAGPDLRQILRWRRTPAGRTPWPGSGRSGARGRRAICWEESRNTRRRNPAESRIRTGGPGSSAAGSFSPRFKPFRVSPGLTGAEAEWPTSSMITR